MGTELRRTDYHLAAVGFGGEGLEIRSMDEIQPVLERAQKLSHRGAPVLVNAHIGSTDFRKGSISI